jgi:hypothetical protein
VENSTLNTLYKEPSGDESKTRESLRSEQTREVHDGTGTMIGIKERESDGKVIAQFNFRWGMKGEDSLAGTSIRNSRICIER